MTLYSLLRARTETRHLIDPLKPPILGDPSESIMYAEVGRLIAKLDAGGENARFWERNVRRWFAKKQAAEPDQIRRALSSLEANWLVGLGHAGYQRHALCLLHGLWIVGARGLAGRSARAIFHRRSLTNDAYAFEAALKSAWRERVSFDSTTSKRLEKAVRACWRGALPIVPRPRPDFVNSEPLHSAFMALEYAQRSKVGPFELRLRSVQDRAAKDVLAWAGPLLKESARADSQPDYEIN